MSNYPPGMSKRDFVRGGIDQPHDHKHDFMCEHDGLIHVEDGAVIVQFECLYAEGEWGEGWTCDEHRSFRYDAQYVWNRATGEGHPVDWDNWTEFTEEGVIAAEDPGAEFVDLDHPIAYGDGKYGFFRVRHGEWEVLYR